MIQVKGFLKCLAMALIVACGVFAGFYSFKGSLRETSGPAAKVPGRPISRLEFEEALREHLWKREEAWAALSDEAKKQTRWLVLENLVNDRLVRAFRVLDGRDAALPVSGARREGDFMRRQFADASEFPRRLADQQPTQKELEATIIEAQLDEAWICEKIAPRLSAVTTAEAEAWYDRHKESLRIPAAYHAAHIFLTRHDRTKPDREAEIREIHRKLMAKDKTFAALAAAHSDDDRTKSIGGDLGWFTRERMPSDFISALEKLRVGEFSDPVLTKLGWHVIVVRERRESRLPVFEEVKDEVLAMLTTQRREEAVKRLIAELRERSQQPPKSLLYHPEVIDRTEPAP